ncbi:hypothetical protein G6F24_018677 [Rhizopus arrhizus]|nr:hypothetical protein G6F24_018677 [Rhizopus arrhizus]
MAFRYSQAASLLRLFLAMPASNATGTEPSLGITKPNGRPLSFHCRARAVHLHAMAISPDLKAAATASLDG